MIDLRSGIVLAATMAAALVFTAAWRRWGARRRRRPPRTWEDNGYRRMLMHLDEIINITASDERKRKPVDITREISDLKVETAFQYLKICTLHDAWDRECLEREEADLEMRRLKQTWRAARRNSMNEN